MTTCKAVGCDGTVYAKGYCKRHYGIFLRTGVAERKVCKYPGCARRINIKGMYSDYCCKHKDTERIKAIRGAHWKGEKNPNWRGGVSEYPNHYEFKKNRLVVLENHNYTCVRCGLWTKEVHHKDGTKTNHALDNIEPLCRSCHLKTFPKTHNSKYREKYGMTIKEMAVEYNISIGIITYRLKHSYDPKIGRPRTKKV